ncbi:MAG: M1 family metallopeptidase [Bacteroidia bacterium]
MNNSIIFLLLILFSFQLAAQEKHSFTRYDYLHGKLTPLRTCFDVKHYDITIRIEPDKKFITARNIITFLVVTDFKKMQIDLFKNLKIDSMLLDEKSVSFTRDSNAVFVSLKEEVKKNELHKLAVYYNGNPVEAKKAPWDGGFVWAKDSSGTDWVGLACEGLGASCWLPCKDHLSDEPDSVRIRLIVPEKLVGVSNGKLVSAKRLKYGLAQYTWEVRNPINIYDITVNVGNYAHFREIYHSKINTIEQNLPLDFYVLKENERKAKDYLATDVTNMLNCFELRFGAYPFWNDGYKMVETPYWGMEHQSCIAYGNNYKKNEYDFDFIIIHESGHEWFGNSLSCTDPAEMWIHESFTTYAEALFVECNYGYQSYLNYLRQQKKLIENKEPMIGPYDVYFHGRKDNDIYYKGTWVLHTLRSVIDNDSVWFALLIKLNQAFYKSNVTTKQIVNFFSENVHRDMTKFFEQYLFQTEIPELEYKIVDTGSKLELHFRWKNTVSGFDMPIKATISKDIYDFIVPTKSWQIIDLNFFNPDDFKIQTEKFLIKLKKTG